MGTELENSSVYTAKLSGVVDVGSNAIRLLIGCVDNTGQIQKLVKQRIPIRLGQDVFKDHKISEKNISKTTQAFERFSTEFQRLDVKNIRIVATSAVREAQNKQEFIQRLLESSGLSIETIDFKEEADLIVQAAVNSLGLFEKPFLLMDIGGGSVEFVIGKNGILHDVISLPLGTVRLLQQAKGPQFGRFDFEKQIQDFGDTIQNFIDKFPQPIEHFIGTGGNMECLGYLRRSLFRKVSRTKVRFHELDYIIEELFLIDKDLRMKKFELREDRADVILPASLLSQFVLSLLGLDKILLPGVGLREGLLLSIK